MKTTKTTKNEDVKRPVRTSRRRFGRLVSLSPCLLVFLSALHAAAAPRHGRQADSDARWHQKWLAAHPDAKKRWEQQQKANQAAKQTGKQAAKPTIPPPVIAAPLFVPASAITAPVPSPAASTPVIAPAPVPSAAPAGIAPAVVQSAAQPSPAPRAVTVPTPAPAPKPLSVPSPKPAVASTPVLAVAPVAAKPAPAPEPSKIQNLKSKIEAVTKPDGAAPGGPGTLADTGLHTQDSPTAAIGDSGRMLIYLIPMLFVTVGGLRLLRNYHEKNGRLPGSLKAFSGMAGGGRDKSQADLLALLNGQRTAKAPASKGFVAALLGGHNLNLARQKAGGSIRVLESVPLGGNALHLVSVRGRTLLLGAGGAGVSLLTEIGDRKPAPVSDGDSDFRALLHDAVADLDELDLERDDTPAEAVVGSLDSAMHDASDTLAERIRRLRTVSEAEAQLREEV